MKKPQLPQKVRTMGVRGDAVGAKGVKRHRAGDDSLFAFARGRRS